MEILILPPVIVFIVFYEFFLNFSGYCFIVAEKSFSLAECRMPGMLVFFFLKILFSPFILLLKYTVYHTRCYILVQIVGICIFFYIFLALYRFAVP